MLQEIKTEEIVEQDKLQQVLNATLREYEQKLNAERKAAANANAKRIEEVKVRAEQNAAYKASLHFIKAKNAAKAKAKAEAEAARAEAEATRNEAKHGTAEEKEDK